jgi:tRNA-dihydrouridine synthase
MRHYFAPLEGLTDSAFRKIHHTYFPGGIDRYYTPFFSPTVHRALTPRETRELPPADAIGAVVIPQLLTKVPEDFLWMAGQCRDLGYEEVNLNLGCPSGTVTAKGKGSGMLRDPAALDAFLEAIFRDTPLPISVKTRIGFYDSAEFPALLEIFNRYPIRELTIHPRIRTAFYKGSVDMDMFRLAAAESSNPLCYNGDITKAEDICKLQDQFPQVESVMIGRGLIADPGMLTPGGTTRDALSGYLDALLEEYLISFGGSRNAMFRMKEHWGLLLNHFQVDEKLAKRLRKTTDLAEYRSVTGQILQSMVF